MRSHSPLKSTILLTSMALFPLAAAAASPYGACRDLFFEKEQKIVMEQKFHSFVDFQEISKKLNKLKIFSEFQEVSRGKFWFLTGDRGQDNTHYNVKLVEFDINSDQIKVRLDLPKNVHSFVFVPEHKRIYFAFAAETTLFLEQKKSGPSHHVAFYDLQTKKFNNLALYPRDVLMKHRLYYFPSQLKYNKALDRLEYVDTISKDIFFVSFNKEEGITAATTYSNSGAIELTKHSTPEVKQNTVEISSEFRNENSNFGIEDIDYVNIDGQTVEVAATRNPIDKSNRIVIYPYDSSKRRILFRNQNFSDIRVFDGTAIAVVVRYNQFFIVNLATEQIIYELPVSIAERYSGRLFAQPFGKDVLLQFRDSGQTVNTVIPLPMEIKNQLRSQQLTDYQIEFAKNRNVHQEGIVSFPTHSIIESITSGPNPNTLLFKTSQNVSYFDLSKKSDSPILKFSKLENPSSEIYAPTFINDNLLYVQNDRLFIANKSGETIKSIYLTDPAKRKADKNGKSFDYAPPQPKSIFVSGDWALLIENFALAKVNIRTHQVEKFFFRDINNKLFGMNCLIYGLHFDGQNLWFQKKEKGTINIFKMNLLTGESKQVGGDLYGFMRDLVIFNDIAFYIDTSSVQGKLTAYNLNSSSIVRQWDNLKLENLFFDSLNKRLYGISPFEVHDITNQVTQITNLENQSLKTPIESLLTFATPYDTYAGRNSDFGLKSTLQFMKKWWHGPTKKSANR